MCPWTEGLCEQDKTNAYNSPKGVFPHIAHTQSSAHRILSGGHKRAKFYYGAHLG